MKRKLSKPDFIFIILIIVGIFIGILIANDYGESWDEKGLILLGEAIQKAYQFPFSHSRVNYSLENLRFYGPSFSLFTSILTRVFHSGENYIQTLEIFHFFEYLTFIFGIIGLYLISKRFFNDWIALIVSTLFFTQPLLFGHAFINPKDIPFMGLFTATIASGMVMTDRISIPREYISLKEVWKTAWSKRRNLTKKQKNILLIAGVTLVCLGLLVILFWGSISNLVSIKIEQLLLTPPSGFITSLIDRIFSKSNEIPIEAYQQKAIHQLIKALRIFFWVSGFSLIFSFGRLSLWETVGILFSNYFSPAFSNLGKQITHIFQKGRWFWILSTGVLLGICTSIRVLGPAALGLVSIYFYGKDRQRWLIPILCTFIIGAFTTYITWPYLWEAPLNNFFRSFREMMDFNWQANVLFNGDLYLSTELPIIYLPKLLLIQLTETAVVLSIIGTGLLIVKLLKKRTFWGSGLLVIFWLFLPLSYVFFSQPTMYDNTRQFLFIYPPAFILAGFCIEFFWKFLKSNWLKTVSVLIVVFPGLLGILNLHPYEYIYYNAFVGGVEGAYGNYELDYWGTSLREAANFLNETAPKNSQIAVMNGPHMFQTFAREDLNIVSLAKMSGSSWVDEFDYLVLFTRAKSHLNNSLGREVIFKVERDNINILTIEKLD